MHSELKEQWNRTKDKPEIKKEMKLNTELKSMTNYKMQEDNNNMKKK